MFPSYLVLWCSAVDLITMAGLGWAGRCPKLSRFAVLGVDGCLVVRFRQVKGRRAGRRGGEKREESRKETGCERKRKRDDEDVNKCAGRAQGREDCEVVVDVDPGSDSNSNRSRREVEQQQQRGRDDGTRWRKRQEKEEDDQQGGTPAAR
jgi:hypothetical protein